ncbi:MAG: hypothetical protein QG629_46 [Patescibacteria group bacterium]|nr:hypothetical protein [Candidatus Saccharibacteria bacterium]MDQ5962964.1 hypothetical protein [Patescibacteria group bacterium]
MFYLISIGVPIFLYFGLPKLLGASKHKGWLLLACVLFFVSWFLPSPEIHGRDTSFTTHFVGGGIFCGFLWLYLLKAIRPKFSSRWLEPLSLFALVCMLGVVNELFEIFLFELGRMSFGITDTSWDLLANTLGALIFYGAYKAWQRTQ